jgi:ABC-type sulfate transport system permease component
MFTRSISETGATQAVASTLKTAPIVLVNWVKHPELFNTALDSSRALGLGSGFLILFSFIILLALRLVVKGKGRY